MDPKLFPSEMWFGYPMQVLEQNGEGVSHLGVDLPTRPSVLQPTFNHHFDVHADTVPPLFSHFPAMHHPEVDYGNADHTSTVPLPENGHDRPSVLANIADQKLPQPCHPFPYYGHRTEADLLFPQMFNYHMPPNLADASNYLNGLKKEPKEEPLMHNQYLNRNEVERSILNPSTSVGDTLSRSSHRNSMDCQVCQSTQANGLHFGARTCAACAAFFRRTISDNKKYICKRSQRCTAASRDGTGYRKICRSCRMKRCIDIGMLPENVQHKRARRMTPPLGDKAPPPSGFDQLFHPASFYPIAANSALHTVATSGL